MRNLLFCYFPSAAGAHAEQIFTVTNERSTTVEFSRRPALPIYLRLGNAFYRAYRSVLLRRGVGGSGQSSHCRRDQRSRLPQIAMLA